MIEIILEGILFLCVYALFKAYKKKKKHYEGYKAEAIIALGDQMSKPEHIAIFISGVLAIILILSMASIVVMRGFFGYLNESAILWLTLAYLALYYLQEYMPHQEWVVYKKGVVSKRGQDPIEWQNIVHYEVLERKEKELLRVEYKGKGIVTRKSDFVLKQGQKPEVIAVFKRQVVGG